MMITLLPFLAQMSLFGKKLLKADLLNTFNMVMTSIENFLETLQKKFYRPKYYQRSFNKPRRRPPPYGRAATGCLPKEIYLTVHISKCLLSPC
jgi:hypothetical protein